MDPSALITAAQAGDFEEVRRLLEAGADPNASTATRTTALLAAAWRGSAPVVRVLLGSGADVSWRDESGATAVILATNQRADCVSALRLLVKGGCDVNRAASNGFSPLMYACLWGHKAQVSTRRPPSLLWLRSSL